LAAFSEAGDPLERPARADGRRTIKRGRKREVRPAGNGRKRQAQADIAVPLFGYKNRIGIDRALG
jgi:transposase, IS5 family